jgi:radical SAM superfamily enzyme YgiQ (UPF0313 family)
MRNFARYEREGNVKRALLVFPRERGKKVSTDTWRPFPMLGLTVLASLFPEDWEVTVANEAIEKVDLDADVDFVGLTALTCVADRAYFLADEFRRRGRTVVLGGVHASLLPEEAKAHADSVLVGEAEGIFHQLIADYRAGCLRPFYRSDGYIDLKKVPLPRRDLLNSRYSRLFKSIETTRGCPNRCEFCSVPIINGMRYRTRSVSHIDSELSSVIRRKGEYLFLTDDNVVGQPEFAAELFQVFKKYEVKWMAFCTLQIARNQDLLALARESGCLSLFIGFESLNQDNLDGARKTFVDTDELTHLIRRIQDHGIGIQGAFIFGFDHDDKDVFKRTVEFVHDTHIELPTLSVLTPFPGTPLRRRLEREGRIIDNHWSHYDMSHVVFKPKLMSPGELQDGYVWAQKYCCSPRSILGRLLRGHRNNFGFFLMSNFALRRAQMEIVTRLRDRQFSRELS